jgi:hypothetical protein
VKRLCLRSPITEPRRKAAEAKRTSTVLHGYHHAVYGLGRSGSLLRRISREAKLETDKACFRLAEGKLTCEMKAHFPTVDDARRAVEPTVRVWEIDADLRLGRDSLRFTFDTADVVDRSPAQPGVAHLSGFAHGVAVVSGTATVHVTRATYPAPPPATFRLNPDAESLLTRYQGYRDGREPLPSMAFFCLTLVHLKGGRSQRAASAAYRIDLPVLRKMGELASTRGMP